MSTSDVSNWPIAELRLVFYDFTLRGEGDRAVVSAVIAEWRERRAIPAADARRWEAALAWRETGGVLPGWPVPDEARPGHCPGCGSEDDLLLFESWRKQSLGKSATERKRIESAGPLQLATFS